MIIKFKIVFSALEVIFTNCFLISYFKLWNPCLLGIDKLENVNVFVSVLLFMLQFENAISILILMI